MNMAKKLRDLLAKPGMRIAPGVYDALTARIVNHCSFRLAFFTGYGVAASQGFPDFGLLTMTEMVESLKKVCDAVSMPILADADTGYGNALNVYRTVKEYEDAGAAGIQLEDQTWPKRCGHMKGKTVIDTAEMVDKIKAAVDARQNKDTNLIIRTDAISVLGFDRAIDRALEYAENGADVLFVEAPTSVEQMRLIPKMLNLPCVINMALGEDNLSVTDLSEMGYKVALYPLAAMLGAIDGSIKMCKHLRSNGAQITMDKGFFNFDNLNNFFGLNLYGELENKFGKNS